MTTERLENKVKVLRDKLQILEDKLYKVTPHKPIRMSCRRGYYCGYCGEPVKKGTHKHKCGQIQDWE
jgi:ferredoxin